MIGTGGVYLVPNLPGIDLPGVFFLRWMADSFAFQEYLTIRRPTSIVIIHNGMTMESLNDLDLSYTPPLSSPWDPVQMAAQARSRANRRADGAESS